MAKSSKSTPKKSAEQTADSPENQKQKNSSTVSNWKSIHVFGFGITQVIAENVNAKVPNNKLTSLGVLFEELNRARKEGSIISPSNIHAVNINFGSGVNLIPKQSNTAPQIFSWDSIDLQIFEDLYQEVIQKYRPKDMKIFSDTVSSV